MILLSFARAKERSKEKRGRIEGKDLRSENSLRFGFRRPLIRRLYILGFCYVLCEVIKGAVPMPDSFCSKSFLRWHREGAGRVFISQTFRSRQSRERNLFSIPQQLFVIPKPLCGRGTLYLLRAFSRTTFYLLISPRFFFLQ